MFPDLTQRRKTHFVSLKMTMDQYLPLLALHLQMDPFPERLHRENRAATTAVPRMQNQVSQGTLVPLYGLGQTAKPSELY